MLPRGGISDGDHDPLVVNQPKDATPFQELYDQGVDRYMGKYSPMLVENKGDVITHTFGVGDGPICINGSEYSMATRDKGSSELLIYLRGGGACTSYSCILSFPNGEKDIPKLGILDADRSGNPVAAWSAVFVPYCDGGFHISDVDSDSNGDGQIDRFQRGLHNLSAALDVAVATFPAPSRILLAGSSAGGYGASFALPLVRKLYPSVPIMLINDSGIGIYNPSIPLAAEMQFKEWNATAFFSASCATCIGDDGHITDYHKWELGQDPNFKLGMLSFSQDMRMSFSWEGGGAMFEQTLLAELSDLESAYPDRMHSFVANGTAHTFLLDGLDTVNALSVTAGGVSTIDWVTKMLNGSTDWTSVNGL